MPEQQGTLTPEQRAVARRIGRQLGAGAAALSLVAAVASLSGASSNWQQVITVQRALIDLANQGDALLIPPLLTLAPMLIVTYLVELLTFAATLGMCYYAGQLAGRIHRDGDMGSVAGSWVMLTGGGAWLLVTLVFGLFTQLDGTFAWFLATIVEVLLANSAGAVHAYVSRPDASFIALHTLILLIQNGLGFGFAVGLSSLVGRRGATHGTRAGRSPADRAATSAEERPTRGHDA